MKIGLLLTSLCFSFIPWLRAQDFEIFVSDAGNFNSPPWKIMRYDSSGGQATVFIAEHVDWPQDILFLEDQNLMLVSSLNTNVISKFDATTGAWLGDWATGINGPTRMSMGPDGQLYVLQWQGNGLVLRFKTDGTALGAFTSVAVPNSIGLAWDAQGNLYVSSYNGKYVRKFDQQGADLGKIITTNLAGPTNLWFAPNGDLMVLDWNAGNVKRFGPDGSYLGIWTTGLGQAEGVAHYPDGRVAIGSGILKGVKLFDADGNFIKYLVQPEAGGLIRPNAVVFKAKVISGVKSPEVAKESQLFVPSTGSSFRWVGDTSGAQIDQTMIFDSTGRCIAKLQAQDTHWNAQYLPSGRYLVSCNISGTRFYQSLFIQQ